MILREYIENLNKLISEKPEALDYTVVTSADDEGNEFNMVGCEPDIGIYDTDGDFIPECRVEEWDRDQSEINAICLN